MHCILLVSTPSGGLTYEDGDVVSVLDAHLSPGTAVVANPTQSWSFLYVTDKEHDDPEMTQLLEADTSGSGETEEFLHKRRYYLTLPGDSSDYTTYYEYDQAPAVMKKAWADVSGFVNDKQE
jgi:hypothetical protein